MKVYVRRLSGESWSWRCGELTGQAKLPFVSAARELLRQGTDPATTLELYHEGSETRCMTGTVGWLAYNSTDQDTMTFRQLDAKEVDQLGLPPALRPSGPVVWG